MEDLEKITIIPKELLNQVVFFKNDVLENDPKRARLRNIYLRKAQTIGNVYKHKVKLYFKTNENEALGIETTIWSADEDFITVKGGSIPTKAILGIDF